MSTVSGIMDHVFSVRRLKIGQHREEIEPFSEFIKQAFSQRRKKLKNNLPDAYESGILDKWADMRPEQISPTNYIKLFQRI